MTSRLPSEAPVLPGFAHVRPLGTGGFADVFLFEQDSPRRPVAVKVLLDTVVDDGVLRMFNAEADVMARLSAHPSILTIYSASVSADGRPYLVTEYCPSSVTDRYRYETMPIADVLDIGIRVASALETAHRAGVLHRDIKPSNILITSFGTPVLADFGIAASLRQRSGEEEVFAMSVPWSAPEVIEERVSGSVAAEVWSLGATVYSLLAGRTPFERTGAGQNSREQLKRRIRRAEYTPIDRADVPPQLQAILARAMHRDPARRFASVGELARELRETQSQLGLPTTPLEIANDVWAAAGQTISFSDDTLRQAAASSVPNASARPERARARISDRLPEGTVLAGSQQPARHRRQLAIVLILLGIVALTGATVLVTLALWG